MMYPWQSFILGLCEHLAWPFVVILGMLLFRKNICQLFDRIKKVGGVEFDSKKISTRTLEQINSERELDTLVAQKSEVIPEQNNISKTEENKECVK